MAAIAPATTDTTADGEPKTATERLFDEACRYMPGGTSRIHYYFAPHPIYAHSAQGFTVTDVDGTDRLDFLNNMTALVHGHRHPAINAAILDQLERGIAFSEPSGPEVRLAKLLVERVASLDKIRFANSGTEAVMMAIKLARAFTGRSKIAKFEGHYHGYYDYVQTSYASTPNNWGPADAPVTTASSGGLADDVLGQVLTMPYNDRDAVERLLARDGRSIAALILDPLSNRAGFPTPAEGFLEFLREITRAHGIVLIYDEVISFRVGFGGAQGKYGGDPDLTAFGKIMGGGMPVGAVGGTNAIMALLDPRNGTPAVASGGTYSANPLTMAAGYAAMEQLTPASHAHLDHLGERLRTEASAAFVEAGVPGQVTGDGSLFRILLTSNPVTDYRSSLKGALPAAQMAKLHLALLDEGVIVSSSGLGCVTTPMGDGEIDRFVDALSRALATLRAET
jgi:glutamate-1-semialdehyde 2,1-aminomutase